MAGRYRSQEAIHLAQNPSRLDLGEDDMDDNRGLSPEVDDRSGSYYDDGDPNMGAEDHTSERSRMNNGYGRRSGGSQLDLADTVSELQLSVSQIAQAVSTIAKAQKQILNNSQQQAQARQLRKHGAMGAGGGGAGSDDDYYAPPPPAGAPGDGMDPGMDDDPGMGGDPGASGAGDPNAMDSNPMPPPDEGNEDRLDLSRTGGMPGFGSKRKLRKDDSANAFGEIDDDTPGNRPWDQAELGVGDTVITGRPGTGPGPMSVVKKAVNDGVAYAMQQIQNSPQGRQITKSAAGPGPGRYNNSQIDKANDPEALLRQAASMGFRELNRYRVEIGELG